MWQYAWLTIKHKYFVFLAGLHTKASIWRLITHDLSKFSWKEYPYYQNIFFGDGSKQQEFALAWLHHQKSNDHHWEWWCGWTHHDRLNPQIPDGSPLPMSEAAVREMIADWIGAHRAYLKEWPNLLDWPWYNKASKRRKLHPESQKLIDKVMKEMIDKGSYCK